MPKKVLGWVEAAQAVLRPRRIGLWRRHGEVTRALLVLGMVIASAMLTGILLRAPRRAVWSVPEVAWPTVGLWAVTVAGVIIPSAVASLTIRLRHAEPKPAKMLVASVLLRVGFYGGLAFGIWLFVTASSWQTRAALGLTTILAALGSAAALWWLGASVILLGAIGAAVVTFLVVDWPWLYDPNHLRRAVLVLVAFLVLCLLAIAREFSRAALRLAALVALGAVVLLTMKLGRLQAVAGLGREARETATELDVQLGDLAHEADERPASQTGQVDRAERALLAATSALDASSTERATLLQALSRASEPHLDLVSLREEARSTAEVEVLGLAETYEALRSAPRAHLGLAESDAQARIDLYCRAADGHPVPVAAPPQLTLLSVDAAPAASASSARTYEHCTEGAGADDGDPRHPGRTQKYAELKAEATWSVTLIRAEVRDVPADDVASAARAAVVAAGGPDGDGTPVDLLATGGVALLGGLPGAGDASVPAAVTIVGWAVVAGVVVLGYRWLEILNGRTQVGPVTVRPIGPATEPSNETERKRLGELRRHIVRNIDEPGGVPGAETLQPVTDLLESTGDPSGKIAGALLKLVGLVFPKTGYAIEAVFSDVPIEEDRQIPETSPGVKAPTGLTVTVLVKDARTGRGQTTITTTSASEQTALREAGYRVAAWVIGRSSRIPTWASWDESTAAALCEYTEANTSGSAGLTELEQAVRIAPASGVLLGLLGHRYDLERRRAYALSAYLRAVALHPRYPVARYRAAISCSLLAADEAKQWTGAGQSLREELKDGLAAVSDVLGLTWSKRSRIPGGALWKLNGCEAVTPLACASDDLLVANNLALTKPSLIHHAFRRSERGYWLALLLRFRSRAIETGVRRDALWAINQSARPAVLRRAASAAGEFAEALEAEATAALARVQNTRGLTWQVDYNLACASAIGSASTSQLDALAYLQGLIRRPHVGQLKRTWVETDPDLEALRTDPWLASFALFLRHLDTDAPAEWAALVQRYVEQVRGARAFDKLIDVSPTAFGAQSVLAGSPLQAVLLHDVREPGETTLPVWQRLPADPRGELPAPFRQVVDAVLKEEWLLVVESLECSADLELPWSDPQDALDCARTLMAPRSTWMVIEPPGSALAPLLTGREAVEGPPTLNYPLVVAVDEAPLTGLFGEPLELNHLMGADTVHFVVHERIGFARRPDSLVVALTGVA